MNLLTVIKLLFHMLKTYQNLSLIEKKIYLFSFVLEKNLSGELNSTWAFHSPPTAPQE